MSGLKDNRSDEFRKPGCDDMENASPTAGINVLRTVR